MKKITLKITTLVFLTMFAFHAQGQIVEGTAYNLRCFGSGGYLTSNDTGTYVVTPAPITSSTDAGLNFLFAIAEAGATDYNIDHQIYRGIMRGAGTGSVIHTNFQPGTTGALPTDKRWFATTLEQSGFTTYRFEIASGGDERFLYEGTDGIYYNITVADMNDAAITYTDGEARSYWLLEESTIIPLSNDKFDTSSIFVSNPVNNSLLIKGLPSDVKQISVYSLLGQEVLSREVNSESVELDVNALTSGMYLIEISGETGKFTKKIIKQ